MSGLAFLWQALDGLLTESMIFAVRLYQFFLSPIFGRQCIYQPTCSHYFIGAVKRYGPLVGAVRGAWRICRCNPFSRGGYDPP